MRLTLAGKIVVYLAVLGGLYVLWTRVPHQVGRVEMPRGVQPAGAEAPPEPAKGHEGFRIGYVGASPAVDAAPLKDAGASLVAEERVGRILAGLESGALDAAVLDFPSVVYASEKGATPFHTVLLVSWRTGADAITVRSGGAWQPAGFTAFEPKTSGEYVARVALDSGRYSPQEKSAGRNQLNAEAAGAQSRAPDAAAGRLDRMTPQERGWTVYRTSEDLDVRMPDVLVVNTRWAHADAARTTALVKAFVDGQHRLHGDAAAWEAFVREQSRTLGLPEAEVAEQMRPAPVEDQLAFAGLAKPGIRYTDLVLRQIAVLNPGPRPPSPDFTVLVDPRPMMEALRVGAP